MSFIPHLVMETSQVMGKIILLGPKEGKVITSTLGQSPDTCSIYRHGTC